MWSAKYWTNYLGLGVELRGFDITGLIAYSLTILTTRYDLDGSVLCGHFRILLAVELCTAVQGMPVSLLQEV